MSRWLLPGLLIVFAAFFFLIVFYPGELVDLPPRIANDPVQDITQEADNAISQPLPTTAPTLFATTPLPTESRNDEIIMEDIVPDRHDDLVVQPGNTLPPTPTPIALEVGKIVGKVLDQDGNPIPSAHVDMQAEMTVWIRRIKSDYAGRFVVSDPPVSSVTIRASMNGYLDSGNGNAVADPSKAEEVVLTLQQQLLSISGKVVRSDTNEVVPGFSLRLFNEDHTVIRHAKSDSFGLFQFENVTKDHYAISSDQDKNGILGFDIAQESNNQKIMLGYQDITEIIVRVTPTTLLRGLVQTMDKKPVSEAMVKTHETGSKAVVTDIQGTFDYQAPKGTVFIASHDQYGIGVSEPVRDEQFTSNQPIIITLQNPGNIFGKAFDQENNPIENVDVSLVERRRGIAYQTQTNAEGIYSFDDVPLITKGKTEEQFTHSIQFSKYGYESKSIDVILYPDEVNTLDAVLPPAAMISGQVLDAAENPLPGVEIQAFGIKGSKAEGVSNENGIFSIHTNKDKTFNLRFQYISAPVLSALELNVPAGTAGLRVVLDHQEWIVSGTVKSNTGESIPAFTVLAVGSKNNTRFQQQQDYTASNGQFQFTLNQPGTYEIQCTAFGYSPVSQPVIVDNAGNPSIQMDFVLQQEQSNGSITGEFVPPTEMELAQVEIVGLASVPTHGNQFFLHKLPEGVYSILFFVQSRQARFPIRLGALSSVEVKRNQETNVGKVTPEDLIVTFQ